MAVTNYPINKFSTILGKKSRSRKKDFYDVEKKEGKSRRSECSGTKTTKGKTYLAQFQMAGENGSLQYGPA